jgi:hypothetical protein
VAPDKSSRRTLASEPDAAKKQSAEEHVRVGMIAFEKRNFALAITELRAAHADVPDPSFLYALGQAYRLSGDCPHAREAYLAFIDSDPTDKQREAALANIDRCPSTPQAATTAPAPAPAPGQEPPRDPAPQPGSPATEAASTRRRAWYEDVPGGVLTGSGVVTTVVGAVVFAGGRGKVADADSVTDDGAFADTRDDADAGLAQQRVGLVVMGVGGALITAGILRYVSVARQSSASSVRVGLTLGGIAAAGTF